MAQRTYEITAPDGRMLEITGDRVPTEAELREIFARTAPSTTAASAPPAPPTPAASDAGVLGNLAIGALKGAGHTVMSLGELVHQVPGFSAGLDALYGTPGLSQTAFAAAHEAVTPTTPAQRVGKVAEQIAEVIVPGSKIAALGEAAATKVAPHLAPVIGQTAARLVPRAVIEGAGSAGLSLMQGGDPRIGAVGGAVAPAIGTAVEALPTRLKEEATKKVVQALGPTKERFKAIAERLAPQILMRGLGGSRQALQTKAASMLETVGDQLDTALQQHGAEAVSTQPIVDVLETAKDAFRTTVQRGGQTTMVVYEPRAVQQLSGLQKILTDLGPDARVDQLVAVRRAWDKVVDQAGGFAHRAGGAIGIPLKEQTEAWAKREATSAIRDQLNQAVPELGAINKEWSFWKNLDDVLGQTLKRTQPHGVGIGQMMAEGAGQVVGGALGATQGVATGVGSAFAVGKLAAMARQVFTSPRWQFVDAKLRNQLADAIVNNNVDNVASALVRISAVQASKTE